MLVSFPLVNKNELTTAIKNCPKLLRVREHLWFNQTIANEFPPRGEQESPYGHEWPASRLTLTDMARLRMISNEVRMPVNQLLKEAVEYYTAQKLPELGVHPGWKFGDSMDEQTKIQTGNESTAQEE